MNVRLKGMTWSHPRGYDPMIACSRLWDGKAATSNPPKRRLASAWARSRPSKKKGGGVIELGIEGLYAQRQSVGNALGKLWYVSFRSLYFAYSQGGGFWTIAVARHPPAMHANYANQVFRSMCSECLHTAQEERSLQYRKSQKGSDSAFSRRFRTCPEYRQIRNPRPCSSRGENVVLPCLVDT